MPNRIIREGLLDSERYWSCTIEARELYRHLQLLADDLGCVSLALVFIRRRCFDSAPSNDKIDGLLQQLSDHDLVRIYEVDGARYGFIPRFGQRLRRMRLKHPRPPANLLENDHDAQEKFNKLNGNTVKLSDICQSDDGHPSAEVKRSEEKRREVEVTCGISDSTLHARQVNVKGVFKKIPQTDQSNSLDIERNRQIGAALAAGNLELAQKLKADREG